MMQRFDHVKAPYNITFSSGPTPDGTNATTNWVPNAGGFITPYNYNIVINSNVTSQATEIAIATSLLHELIHAYFLSIIDDCMQSGNCTQLQQFIETYQYFENTHTGVVPTDNIPQHNDMANFYVNTIGATLQEYATGVAVESGQQSQLYSDLAWTGLQETTAFGALPEVRQRRISGREGAEYSNQTFTLIATNTSPSLTTIPSGSRNLPNCD